MLAKAIEKVSKIEEDWKCLDSNFTRMLKSGKEKLVAT